MACEGYGKFYYIINNIIKGRAVHSWSRSLTGVLQLQPECQGSHTAPAVYYTSACMHPTPYSDVKLH